MMEESEEQTKELNEYVQKVCEKYKLNNEELVKNLMTDTEVLRKRQKVINYGKLTEEYVEYAAKVPR